MHINDRSLERIAFDIDRFGINAVEFALDGVVDRARSADVSPVLVSVLADPSEPEIARARAFGMIATRVAGRAAQPAGEAPVLAAAC